MRASDKKNLADRLRMRTALLIPLLIAFFAWTTASLLLVRVIVEQETRHQLHDDLQLSRTAYQQVQNHHREMVAREAVLMAQLPTMKALMSSNDPETIRDAGVEFWKSSGSDLFALVGPNGNLEAAFRRQGDFSASDLSARIRTNLQQGTDAFYLNVSGTLYEVAVRPLTFGPPVSQTVLGYIALGYALDDSAAREIGDATAAEVAFLSDGQVLSATMPASSWKALAAAAQTFVGAQEDHAVTFSGVKYLGTSVPLSTSQSNPSHKTELVILKSFAREQRLLARVNRWILSLSIVALFGASMIVLAISRSITRPLAALMDGVRALGRGDFAYKLPEEGAEEVRELSRAFVGMREQVEQSQRELIQGERLATIGRMASSISHDLRHYLSAIYANAEFLSDGNLPAHERDELFEEVRVAVLGMTDMLDSLLLFTQTGRSLRKSDESVAMLLQRSMSMLRGHPAARDVLLSMDGLSSARANVDSVKLGRAVYNLLLNGCQAAKLGAGNPEVRLRFAEDESYFRIHVEDNGEGVPEAVERTMFQPFVSEGKQSGTGLGLTLAEQVAVEHGGYIHHARTSDGWTLFSIVLPRDGNEAKPIEYVPEAVEEAR